MATTSHFGPGLFQFLRELAENNEREWFQANKRRYEAEVRGPFLRFIEDFGPRLRAFAPRYVADPRPVGGSMFRIHRDVRFSKDKRPYKTAAAGHFYHERHKDAHAPGFYLGLEPGSIVAGAGIWRPDAPTLAKVRDAIVARPDAWTEAVSGPELRDRFEFRGEALKRPPRGYDPEHPLIEALKRKDFVVMTPFDEAAVCAPEFLDRFDEACRTAAPLVRFLTVAVGLPW